MAFDSGEAKRVLIEWEVDPSKAEAGIKKVAKEIRDEQKIERDLSAIRSQLAGETQKLTAAHAALTAATQQLGPAFDKLNFSAASFGAWVGGIGVNLVTGFVGKLKDMAVSFLDNAEAAYKFEVSAAKHGNTIERLVEGSKHLVSQTEALAVVKKLAAAGYELTDEKARGVGATIARLTKIYGNQEEAVSKVSKTILTTEVESLKALNIQVKDTGDLESKRNQILEQMAKVAGPAINALDEMTIAQNKLKDAELEYYKTTGSGGAWHQLKLWWLKQETEEVKRQTEIEKESVQYMQIWADIWRSIAGPAKVDWKARLKQAGAAAPEGYKPLTKLKGPLEWGIDASEGRKGERFPVPAERSGHGDPDAFKGWKKVDRAAEAWRIESGSEIEADIKKMVKEEQQRRRNIEADTAGYLMQRKAERELSKANAEAAVVTSRKQAALERYNETLREHSDLMRTFVAGPLQSFTEGLVASTIAAIDGSQSIGMALANVLKSTLANISGQAAIRGMWEVAQALGAQGVTWGIPNTSSTNHWASAGMFFAVAGLAGGAAGGIGAAMNAGSGAGAGATGYENQVGRDYSSGSVPAYGRPVENNQPINLNIYLNDITLPAAKVVADLRQAKRLMRAS